MCKYTLVTYTNHFFSVFNKSWLNLNLCFPRSQYIMVLSCDRITGISCHFYVVTETVLPYPFVIRCLRWICCRKTNSLGIILLLLILLGSLNACRRRAWFCNALFHHNRIKSKKKTLTKEMLYARQTRVCGRRAQYFSNLINR